MFFWSTAICYLFKPLWFLRVDLFDIMWCNCGVFDSLVIPEAWRLRSHDIWRLSFLIDKTPMVPFLRLPFLPSTPVQVTASPPFHYYNVIRLGSQKNDASPQFHCYNVIRSQNDASPYLQHTTAAIPTRCSSFSKCSSCPELSRSMSVPFFLVLTAIVILFIT